MQSDLDDTLVREGRKQRGLLEQEADRMAIADLTEIMDQAVGRRVLHRQLAASGAYRSSFVAGDPHMTSFNEGQRNMALFLLSQITTHCPEHYGLMLQENTSA